jgi:aminoglycoside phosphotransferase (APT) family kinase protein
VPTVVRVTIDRRVVTDADLVRRVVIDADLVRRLVATQLPQWAHLPVRPVEVSGWDNCTFRLGDDLSVRLPSAAAYVDQVAKEQRWLPVMAPQLSVPIPRPVALGAPGDGYPWPWSVYGWIDGDLATPDRLVDVVGFARDVAGFLVELHGVDTADGPPPGSHNFHRGGSLAVYDEDVRRSLGVLGHRVDTRAAIAVWDGALASEWLGRPVWVHGDVAQNNLLVRHGRLSAVLDFGSSAVGDPACDLVIAWTTFDGDGRAAFREAVAADVGTWARARGWALWKALLVWAEGRDVEAQRRVVRTVLAEHAELG